MASVGNYQQMAAARWYAGAMGQQLERRSKCLYKPSVKGHAGFCIISRVYNGEAIIYYIL